MSVSVRIYFDTNIYDWIVKLDQVDRVRGFLVENRCRVMASATNLIEIWRIPNRHERNRQIRAVTQLATDYEHWPDPYLQVREVLDEMRRHRPEWIRRFIAPSAKRNVTKFITGHRDLWRNAKADPDHYFFRMNAYMRDATTVTVEPAKTVRRMMIGEGQDIRQIFFGNAPSSVRELSASLPDEEFYWRMSSASHFYSALFTGIPALRDYRDFMTPWFIPHSVRTDVWYEFWLSQASGKNMPRSCILGLTEFYQLFRRVIPSNQQDINHSSHLLDCDFYLTADGALSSVLVSVCQRIQNVGIVRLVRKAATDAVREIETAIRSDGSNVRI